MCGANTLPVHLIAPALGSSPRVRGELPVGPAGLGRDRIIPACAGRTFRTSWPRFRTPDHPRVCGANMRLMITFLMLSGSSPRVRGEHADGLFHSMWFRIIPACAGRTASTRPSRRRAPDHPRVCGANCALAIRFERVIGSSPRVRGEHDARPALLQEGRIIPACAGRTRRACTRSRLPPDHPRVCGANDDDYSEREDTYGSSPRVRGEHVVQPRSRLYDRIIPACAGRTTRYRPRTCAWPDHPRVCGANVHVGSGRCTCGGSSPRVRGELQRESRYGGLGRIIPACAGRTRSSVSSTRRRPDHPRVCGANSVEGSKTADLSGSSPRVRGEQDNAQ